MKFLGSLAKYREQLSGGKTSKVIIFSALSSIHAFVLFCFFA